MKINAVKDQSGKVVATFESATGASVMPVLPAGHKVEQIEVADNYRDNLHLIYSPKA
jgi:hypothetical protein